MDRRTQIELMRRLRRDADRICVRFDLRYRSIEPERANVKRRYGICYDDGSIKIRLRHASTGEPLKYSSLINTLCHELAHLKHFNHGPHFKAFYARILAWARHEGIYQPRPASVAARPALLAPTPGFESAHRVTGARAEHDGRSPTRPTPTPTPKPVQLDLFG